MEKVKKIPSLSRRRYDSKTSVSTNDLLDSWIDINDAIANGGPFMVSRVREKHLALFSGPDQVDAAARFDCITNSTSEADAEEYASRAANRSTTQEIKVIAA